MSDTRTRKPWFERRGARGAILICAVLVAIGTACAAYRVVASRRNNYFTEVDPASGYKMEYTVSAGFIHKPNAGIFASDGYVPKPPPPVIEWMLEHLLRRPPRSSNDPETPVISQYFWETAANSGYIKLGPDGYPELKDNSMGAIIVSQHCTVAGCPATWAALDAGPAGPNGSHLYWSGFAVHPAGTSSCIAMVALSLGTDERRYAEAELRAIRDSVRIIKVK